jgi:hypothetical protein
MVVEMKNESGAYVASILMIFLGIMIIFKPVFYSRMYARYIDLSGFNIPLGVAFVIVGVIIIWPRKPKT